MIDRCFAVCRRRRHFHLLCSGIVGLCLVSVARAEFCPDQGTVVATTDAATGDAPFIVQSCDLDGNGTPDLLTANDASDTVSVLLNNGDGTFAPSVQWPVDEDAKVVSEPVDAVCCDVDGDTLIDLVSVNHTSDDVSVLFNTGGAQFAPAVKYTVGEAPFAVECRDLDGVGGMDLVTTGFTEDALSVLLNNGDGTFAPHVTYATGDGPIAMTMCDADGDTRDDVVTANMLGKSVSVMRNNGDGTLTSIDTADICRTPTDCINPFDITCCDFDGVDGPDVATSNGIDDSVAVLFNDGSGILGGLQIENSVDGAYGVVCCDVDGDTRPDVISANLTSDDLGLFLNEGGGMFAPASFLPVGVDSTANPSAVICADLDMDMDTDLVTSFVDGLTVFENDCSGGGVCGDGVIDSGETCDDGFTDACGTCNATCTGSGTGSTCGDGTRCPETEECDDGNNDPDDGCSATCEVEPNATAPDPLEPTGEEAKTNRYLRFSAPLSTGVDEVIRVRIVSLDGFALPASDALYVGPPFEAPEENSDEPEVTFTAAPLQCAPHGHDWSAEGTISAYGAELMPGSAYDVERARAACADLLVDESCWSTALRIETAKFGDVVPLFDAPGNPTQPDFNDISGLVNKFLAVPGAPIKAVGQLQPNVVFPLRAIDFKDIAAGVEAFLGTPYPAAIGAFGPCVCPSDVVCGATACAGDSACGEGFCIDGFCTDPCGRCTP